MPSAVGSRIVPGLLVLLGITALVPIWIADPLPLQDLPNHLLKVVLLDRYLAHDATVRALFAVDRGPVPNTFCYAALLLLSRWMPLATATRAYLSGCVVALLAAGFVWVRTRNPDNLLLAIVPAGIVYTRFMTKGFLNYVAAEPMYVGCLALVSRAEFRARDGVALGAVALLLFETHGFAFLALLVASAGYLLLVGAGWTDARRRLLPFLPALVLLAVWSVRSFGVPPGGEPPSTPSWPQLDDPVDFVQRTWLWLVGDARGWGWAATWLLGVAAVLATSAARIARELRAGDGLRAVGRRHAFLLVAVGMGLGYLLGPDLLARHAAVRWLPLILLTMLAGAIVPTARAGRVAVGALLVAGTLGLHLKTAEAFVADARDVREYVAGMAALEPDAAVLPIDVEEAIDVDRASLHAWAYYHIGRGGWGPRVHAWQGRHPIYYRRQPWTPPENVAEDPLTPDAVDRVAACYDYVVVWDPDGAGVGPLAPRFEPLDAPSGSRLHVWRNRAGVRRRPPLDVPACFADAAPGTGRL